MCSALAPLHGLWRVGRHRGGHLGSRALGVSVVSAGAQGRHCWRNCRGVDRQRHRLGAIKAVVGLRLDASRNSEGADRAAQDFPATARRDLGSVDRVRAEISAAPTARTRCPSPIEKGQALPGLKPCFGSKFRRSVAVGEAGG